MTGQSRVERRKAETRHRILAAAESLILAQGLRATTVDQVAEQADVGKGTIYGYFASKEEIFAALLDQALDADAAYMDEAFREDNGPVEQLYAVGEQYVRFCLERPGSFSILAFPDFDRRYEQMPAAAERIADRIELQVGRVADAITRATESGEIHGEPDPVATARFLHGAFNGVLTFHLRTDRLHLDEQSLRTVLEQGIGLLARALFEPVEG
ncbi:MAG TPA: TetR/AcrR family transcriptional regulator [Solirubrobacterales bacterium]|nr:TetR/AcrR family transcriptional regulator [Solirubrobacterales bacterium]